MDNWNERMRSHHYNNDDRSGHHEKKKKMTILNEKKGVNLMCIDYYSVKQIKLIQERRL